MLSEIDSGAAYIFHRVNQSWTENIRIGSTDPTADDHFGYNVAIDGGCALVGAPYKDGTQEGVGAVYLFRFTGTGWDNGTKITPPAYVPVDGNFGSVVAAGTNLVVGSWANSAYMY